jgi:hypothetical protein
MDSYNKIFLEQARIGYNNFARQYREKEKFNILYKRKNSLNRQFFSDFTNIARVDEINNYLKQKERAAYDQAEQLEQYMLLEMKKDYSFISDYEIEFRVSLFAENKYNNVQELQGDSFFQYEPTLGFIKFDENNPQLKDDKKDWLFNVNHNEHTDTFEGQHHCWLLHELYHHTYLSWQDIIDIEEVWFEVILKVQNFESIKSEE